MEHEQPGTTQISSRLLYCKEIAWRELKFIQQDDFKELPKPERQKLKNSLLGNEFADPFKVCQDTDGVVYCLDGKHRTLILEELIADGIKVPDMLPANFINCKDKKEAAKLVLIFSSSYAQITPLGMENFIALNELSVAEILEQISIPAINFEALMPIPPDLDGEPKAKPATMKITFGSYQDLEAAMPLIDDILKTKFPGAFSSVSFGEI